ncbi:site-specific DNA-methyltransferase [Frigoribacterium sp. Leaf44]|uniref:site-specific DNA-methyltransferase n=1 Tax=Frigoribacterium sp. Leaf44 TaxID=1736220 RepID=UPI0006FBB593|nr:DNA methyltransferase [Frigoribacterium sp. Leaf44]KQN45408.1 DNA methyltransferase [Frigoribacterium sp. Leaf44]
MSRLTDLLRAAKQLDPQLGADLEEELKPLQKRLPFGLNFERHAPEAVELPGHAIRKTSKVRRLPPRRSTTRGDQRLWKVESVTADVAVISLLDAAEPETATVPVDDLVLVAEFRDRIYPGLRPDGSVERGADKPFHTVINGENFHVLEQLTFTHEHAVDAIYIDPPYNTGSRDWKYNNDYVEGDDLYRHSKWLAFMERRLRIAKQLLKPDDSVLIVTIDEKEYLRLGLLLEQTFPEARITMISAVINPAGVTRPGSFSRTDEYLFFVQFGGSRVSALPLGDEWRLNPGDTRTTRMLWSMLIRTGTNARRVDRPNLFYPIFVSEDGLRLIGAGESPQLSVDRGDVQPPDGSRAIWPMRRDGTEGNWQISQDKLLSAYSDGYVRLGRFSDRGMSLSYLKSGEQKKVLDGTYEISGRRPDGSIISSTEFRSIVPSSAWRIPAHDSSRNGSNLLSAMMPDRKFPFPKSLYAVEDALRFFVDAKPEAVVLDFFAGSGTTAHAVMRLNRQDGGRRQCISVTNNEVSAGEQSSLRLSQLRPGDPEWERLGICEFITKPRITAAISGNTTLDAPIKGDYKFVDEFPMSDGFEENAAFFTLTYESPWMVSNDRAFAAIAPMLWLRAGAQGARIDSLSGGWAVAETYGVLRDLDQAAEFARALRGAKDLRIAFIVTDDEGRYQQVADELRGLETVRLYEDYLRNCENMGDL